MASAAVDRIAIPLPGASAVAGLFCVPAGAQAACVLAHGAGAGMGHPFMTAVAELLAQRGVATLRYQFPYMEQGKRRPDPPAVAHATVRAAVDAAVRRLPDLPLFAGGKSFGGRMTSQAQSLAPLPGIRGLVFLGFPLHPAKRPSVDRAEHLSRVELPMLFVQGARDALAEHDLISRVAAGLGNRATLFVVPGADHSLHVPARTGHTDAQVLADACDTMATWMAAH